MSSGPLNSSKPTTSVIVGGVYNAVFPAPLDGQALPLQQDFEGNLLVSVAAGGGVASNINIADIAGNPPSLHNPLPVELSDGTNAFGTVGNPLHVNIGAGPFAVTGTFYQATQPVSIASGQIAAGAAAAGAFADGSIYVRSNAASTFPVNIGAGPFAVTGTFWQATQPISIASGQIATGAAATGAFADGSIYVRSNAASTFPVTASIAAAQSIAVTQATASNLNAAVVGTGTATAPAGGVLTVQGPIQTGNAPAAATVGASSGIAVAANSSRTGLALVNTSANIISIGFGANAAVLYSGITLYPAGSLTLNILDGCQQAITAIASAAGSNLAVQEMI